MMESVIRMILYGVLTLMLVIMMMPLPLTQTMIFVFMLMVFVKHVLEKLIALVVL